MKYAFIGTSQALEHLCRNHLLDPYHMALGPSLLEDRTYLEYYQAAHRKGHFIMVDNGAAEGNGDGMFGSILKLTIQEDFDEVVLPDALGNRKETLRKYGHWFELVPPRMTAICPQGEGSMDCLRCLEGMHAMYHDFSTICVPKHLGKGRVDVLKELHANRWDSAYNIHLLGLHGRPTSEIPELLATGCRVRGLDSAAPLAWAQHNLELTAATVTHVSVDLSQTAKYPRLLLEKNIKKMRELCHGTESTFRSL